jgi:hypothetical protein
MTEIIKGLKVVEKLPADHEMIGEAAPLHTDQYAENAKITEFLKGKEYLKKMLVQKLTS